MKNYYIVKYKHSGGSSWRLYRVWFFQSLIKIIANTLLELESTKKLNDIDIESITKL